MNEPKEKSYIVTEIEFDYDDGNNMQQMTWQIGYLIVANLKHLMNCSLR